jgi:hypothetical protein
MFFVFRPGSAIFPYLSAAYSQRITGRRAADLIVFSVRDASPRIFALPQNAAADRDGGSVSSRRAPCVPLSEEAHYATQQKKNTSR